MYLSRYLLLLVTSPLLQAFTSCPPWAAVAAPAHCGTGHYEITQQGLFGLLSNDAIDRVAKANIFVDSSENHWAPGHLACNGNLPNPLFIWFPYTPGPYERKEHFDRVGSRDVDHDIAFRDGLQYVWSERRLFVDFLRQAQSCSQVAAALNELGRALHALQDAYSHSNYVESDKGVQAAYDAALQNVDIIPAGRPVGIMITEYDASDPAKPEAPEPNNPVSYDHCAHAKDYPGKNVDSSPAAFQAAISAAVFATQKFMLTLLANLPAADAQKLRSFAECQPCIPYIAGTSLSNCNTPRVTGEVITSGDPNDKTGPQGVGAQQYVSAATPLTYAVFFGNEPTATAPAQTVTITDPLSSLSDDFATFAFGPVSFGSQFLFPPPGTSYSTTVDLRPQTNLLVGVSAAIDLKSGQVGFKFTSLDPATGQPTTDPTAGFLPPGGNGSVFFTVMPKQGLSTGVQVQNKATVVFDLNAPINTPTWFNTLDNTPPTTRVLQLPSIESRGNFTVQWQGSDIGSGIQDYTIYVSDNQGPFAEWLTNATSNQATYIGAAGHTYGFYSIGRNLVGNVEGMKSTPDALTEVQGPTCAADVSLQAGITQGGFRYNHAAHVFTQIVTVTNYGDPLPGASLVLDNLSAATTLNGSNGATQCDAPLGSPFISIPGTLATGQSASLTLTFSDPTKAGIQYSTRVLAGNGQQ